MHSTPPIQPNVSLVLTYLVEPPAGNIKQIRHLSELDPLYDQAVAIVTETRKASISYVQRRLRVGYNRSATMLEQMEAQGVVSSLGHNGGREVLAPPPIKD